MKWFEAVASAPRTAISVVYALHMLENLTGAQGSTYAGLRSVMGLRTDSGVRQAVQLAKENDLVAVFQTGSGKGAKAVVKLTPVAREFLATITKGRG